MGVKFYQQLEQWLIESNIAVATVIQSHGSVPREVGAKMLISPDGHTFGTIGGGAGEAKVIGFAKQLLDTYCTNQLNSEEIESPQKDRIQIDLTGIDERDTQGVCGGIMQVWVEVWPASWGLAIARAICQKLGAGQSSILVTPFSPSHNPYLAKSDSFHVGLDQHSQCFVERIIPSPALLIIGAGHVGEALAKAAHVVDFQVSVQDDRLEWLIPERFPAYTRLLRGAISLALAEFSWPENLYIALVTRGVTWDVEALKLILNYTEKPRCCYIGMIGSLKRIHHVFQTLKLEGLSSDRIDAIHAPIGLDIGALTPEEIAISICAELIQVRRQGNIH